jgi:hypothetical protein
VPAGFRGLYGIRPTHGRLDVSGMMQQAPSSDTMGWFARDIATFGKVSSVMLDEAIPTGLPRHLIIAVDAFAFADPEVGAALQPMVERLRALVGDTPEEVMAPAGIVQWARAQRTLQPSDAWLTFKDWIDRDNPRFAFSVARNLILGSMIPDSERGWAQLIREEARGRMRFGEGCLDPRVADATGCHNLLRKGAPDDFQFGLAIHLGCMAGEPVEAQNNMSGALVRAQGQVMKLPSGLGSILKTGLRSSEDFRKWGRSLRCEAQAELSRKVMAGEVISGRRGVSPLTGDREFESISLQR